MSESHSIEDVVKRIDAIAECNALSVVKELGNGNSVEFLFGGGSTGIGVSKVDGGYIPYREIRDCFAPEENSEPDIEAICPACSLEAACCRAYAEILLEELELR